MDEKHIIPSLAAIQRFGVEVDLRKLYNEGFVIYNALADMEEQDAYQDRAEAQAHEQRQIDAAEARLDAEDNARRTVDPLPNNLMVDVLNRFFNGPSAANRDK